MFLRTFSLMTLFVTGCLSASWQDYWVSAVKLCENGQFAEAEISFDQAIQEMEKGEVHNGAVYIDRAKLCILVDKDSKALSDINKALSINSLTQSQKKQALLSRFGIFCRSDKTELAMNDYNEWKSLNPDLPKAEFYEERVIIRDVPDCECFRNIIREIYKYDDVTFLNSNISIIELKKNRTLPVNAVVLRKS